MFMENERMTVGELKKLLASFTNDDTECIFRVLSKGSSELRKALDSASTDEELDRYDAFETEGFKKATGWKG